MAKSAAMSSESNRVIEAASSVLDRIRELERERNELREGAKAELLEKAQDAVEELNSLGFQFRLVEGNEPAERFGVRRTPKDGPCPICEFKTSPLHDGRAHRSQVKKEPFTKEELTEKGYVLVE